MSTALDHLGVQAFVIPALVRGCEVQVDRLFQLTATQRLIDAHGLAGP
ncbi:MAG: hypothetical protein ACRENP_25985 [Longimicrobiales bacterium]